MSTMFDNPTLEKADLDPAFAEFLAQAAALGNPPLESLPAPVMRQIYRDQADALGLPAPEIGKVFERSIPGPVSPLRLRVYEPSAQEAQAPLPVLLFIHGGGFVMGDLQTHDMVCRTLCSHTRMLVVAVDYRLAPEHPFPAAHDDAEAALRWLHTSAATLGADPSRIVIAGDSAGAQLALVAARRVQSPGVRALGMIYPAATYPNEHSASYQENGEGKFLTKDAMHWFVNTYLDGHTPEHPDFSLLKSDLAALPTTWVATMGHDPLRDEGHALALRAEAAGVLVTHRHYPGAIHACIHFSAISPIGPQILADLAQWLRQQV